MRLPIVDRRFSLAIQIYSISYFSGTPLVSVKRAKLPSPIAPNSTKIVITLILLRWRQPRQMGLEVEANVPTAETMPAPIPLALEGYSSQKQTWKKQKKKETHALKMKTRISSKMAQQLRSWSSGFLMKVISNAHRMAMEKSPIPVLRLQIFQMSRQEGMNVTSSERLTMILLMQMLKPMLSMMRLGPQYIAQVMKDTILQQIVMVLKLENLHRSIGVMYLSLQSSFICCCFTDSISSSSKTSSLPLFILPIRFSAFRACSTPFFNRNWGVSSMQIHRSTNSTIDGTVTRMIQFTLQEGIKKKKSVVSIAPIVKKICIMTEYFCLFQSPTTSPKKKKQMLIPASQPHPQKNMPTATRYMLGLTETIMAPIVQMSQETRIELLLPKLSEKKEIAMQPTNAPKQTQLLTKSTMQESSQKNQGSVARELYQLSSGSKQLVLQASGSLHTYYRQSPSEMRRPLALQSKALALNRKPVLSRIIPVTNHMIKKMRSMKS